MLAEVGDPAAANCTGRSQEVHETLKRSRGGSPDPYAKDSSCVALCATCHRFTEAEVKRSTAAGLLHHSWQRAG